MPSSAEPRPTQARLTRGPLRWHAGLWLLSGEDPHGLPSPAPAGGAPTATLRLAKASPCLPHPKRDGACPAPLAAGCRRAGDRAGRAPCRQSPHSTPPSAHTPNRGPGGLVQGIRAAKAEVDVPRLVGTAGVGRRAPEPRSHSGPGTEREHARINGWIGRPWIDDGQELNPSRQAPAATGQSETSAVGRGRAPGLFAIRDPLLPNEPRHVVLDRPVVVRCEAPGIRHPPPRPLQVPVPVTVRRRANVWRHAIGIGGAVRLAPRRREVAGIDPTAAYR